MKDAEKIEYIRTILNIADALDVDRALALYISGIEPRGTAEWIMDETYNQKKKLRRSFFLIFYLTSHVSCAILDLYKLTIKFLRKYFL